MAMNPKVMVLAGGPDREREVSLKSGEAVAQALRDSGHTVRVRDAGPDNLHALEEFEQWGGHVVFPVMHGSWGEGGPLQRLLERQRLRFVGCRAKAAELCMNKHSAKAKLMLRRLPTPQFQVVAAGDTVAIGPPVVVKPVDEGSSVDLRICHDTHEAFEAVSNLGPRYGKLLVEKYVKGIELTVGVLEEFPPIQDMSQELDSEATHRSMRSVDEVRVCRHLPPIRIVPKTEFYSYEAKYLRDDTEYWFDPEKIGLSADELEQIGKMAVDAHLALGCRHMSRVDFIVDEQRRPWILELNTIPGFTDHSLLPKSAAKAGIPMPDLVAGLVRLALVD